MNCKGKILKGIGGFYYIKPEDSDDIIECKARGKFRNLSLVPIIGDVVDVELSDEPGKGSITQIYPRKNSFIRPAVSNIDCLFIVAACDNPKPDFAFIDKMLVIAAVKNVECIICFNKTDLIEKSLADEYARIYTEIGYTVLTTNFNFSDTDKIRKLIEGKTTAFTGFSGVGKSTLLNSLLGHSYMQTGEVSKKIGRGKHTTRHVELLPFENNSYIADTPGFSTLDLPDIQPDELKGYFVEFKKYEDGCKFTDCMHISEKFCSVYSAWKNGRINDTRFSNYLEFYNILKDKKEW